MEHDGPGIYDEKYLRYLVKLVRKADEYGIVVFIDPHQVSESANQPVSQAANIYRSRQLTDFVLCSVDPFMVDSSFVVVGCPCRCSWVCVACMHE